MAGQKHQTPPTRADPSCRSQPARRIPQPRCPRQALEVEEPPQEGAMLPAALCSQAGAGAARTTQLPSPAPTLSSRPADPSFPGAEPRDLPRFPPRPHAATQVQGAAGNFGASLKLRACLSTCLDKSFLLRQGSVCRAGTALIPRPLFKGWANAVALPQADVPGVGREEAGHSPSIPAAPSWCWCRWGDAGRCWLEVDLLGHNSP